MNMFEVEGENFTNVEQRKSWFMLHYLSLYIRIYAVVLSLCAFPYEHIIYRIDATLVWKLHVLMLFPLIGRNLLLVSKLLDYIRTYVRTFAFPSSTSHVY